MLLLRLQKKIGITNMRPESITTKYFFITPATSLNTHTVPYKVHKLCEVSGVDACNLFEM